MTNPTTHGKLYRAANWGPVLAALMSLTSPADAHPHVFIDGHVDFVFRDKTVLEEVHVTWLYDAFETLYILSSHGLSLNSDGGLDEADRQTLVALRRDFPSDFDGSVHLLSGGQPVALAWPKALDAHLIDGRLQVTFSRDLVAPLDLDQSSLDVGFYESTYFFAFKLTEGSTLLGDPGPCSAKIQPFVADAKDSALQEVLSKLSREETPDTANVGALFADRISLICA